ncbi:hypothetical protein L249_2922 [Ophiocordyceps polyrhachis-furcata BCC 54312]|uniref:Uncharacterized protein n=1 Tax=Ophiocordyceps polyrhachis-furcata BCC 54312 TaxID=1330021 RepID=A0A367LSP8_9HYPO|nr:hypothetical protein L249_2922 [Ophiocordyceps polyrhachis-furcata BCC 54312]
MAALSEADLQRLFSGAPQFFARSESHYHGPPHPSVAFPLDEELEIRDLTDHDPISHRAWSGLTAWPHLPRVATAAASDHGHDGGGIGTARFHIRCSERPNMLSAQGLERGTVGYQAALELATADALDEEESALRGADVGSAVRAVDEARRRIVSDAGCLRALPESDLLDRLRRNGELHRANDLSSRDEADSHGDLFDNLLRPCGSVVDKAHPCSLPNQVVALLRCLGTPYVWIDLGRVEWRLRIGQVLWGRGGDDGERYWLLLQILVASELLLRLDAITQGVEYGSGRIKGNDVAYFERGATPAVKWSLVLARSWLENIKLVRQDEDRPPSPSSELSATNDILLLECNSSPQQNYAIKARQGQRQVDGLIYFARRLNWPGIDGQAAAISQKARRSTETPTNPERSAPPSPPADAAVDTTYFGAWDLSYCLGGTHGAQTRRRRLLAALDESGWLSKSYLSGLVMPGDAMGQLLMATLLEKDEEALAKLGPLAMLSSGFAYSGKSFWSTSCVVGRVLAAGEGVAECMGWISTPVVPQGIEADGWAWNIHTQSTRGDVAQLGKKARLWSKKRLERESSIRGDGQEDSVLPADFIMPHEQAYALPSSPSPPSPSSSPPNLVVKLVSLELSAGKSVRPTPLSSLVATKPTERPEKGLKLPSHTASLDFLVSVPGCEDERVKCQLMHDVNFVTAHPCAPSHRVKMLLNSPSSPTVQKMDFSSSDVVGNGWRSAYKMGHPLHKFYSYSAMHISDLVRKPRTSLAEFLGDPWLGRGSNNRVLVVDCVGKGCRGETPMTSPAVERVQSCWPLTTTTTTTTTEGDVSAVGSDLEVLARALCAQRGWNAIVSRRKRGCLACAIREAGALGWKVILRV